MILHSTKTRLASFSLLMPLIQREPLDSAGAGPQEAKALYVSYKYTEGGITQQWLLILTLPVENYIKIQVLSPNSESFESLGIV